MDQENNLADKIKGNLTELLDAYQDLFAIKAAEHASQGISVSILSVIVLVLATFVLLFAGIGTAWWIGERIENMKAGFFIVGGLYVLGLLILLLCRKTLLPHVRNFVIKKMYEPD